MIKLFVTDIDGCLAEPYEPYDLEGLGTLRRLADEAQGPTLSICSGRPYPYVEAMTQALDLTTPVLFEAGRYRIEPAAARLKKHWRGQVQGLRHGLDVGVGPPRTDRQGGGWPLSPIGQAAQRAQGLQVVRLVGLGQAPVDVGDEKFDHCSSLGLRLKVGTLGR